MHRQIRNTRLFTPPTSPIVSTAPLYFLKSLELPPDDSSSITKRGTQVWEDNPSSLQDNEVAGLLLKDNEGWLGVTAEALLFSLIYKPGSSITCFKVSLKVST